MAIKFIPGVQRILLKYGCEEGKMDSWVRISKLRKLMKNKFHCRPLLYLGVVHEFIHLFIAFDRFLAVIMSRTHKTANTWFPNLMNSNNFSTGNNFSHSRC